MRVCLFPPFAERQAMIRFHHIWATIRASTYTKHTVSGLRHGGMVSLMQFAYRPVQPSDWVCIHTCQQSHVSCAKVLPSVCTEIKQWKLFSMKEPDCAVNWRKLIPFCSFLLHCWVNITSHTFRFLDIVHIYERHKHNFWKIPCSWWQWNPLSGSY